MARKKKALGILGGIVLLLSIEAGSSLTFDSTPSVSVVANASTPGRAVAVLGGAGMPQEQIDQQVKRVLQGKGNYFEFIYSQTAFDEKVATDYILDTLQSYPDVTFFTLSMGGMLAHDTIHKAKQRGSKQRFKLIMVDSPASGDDVRMHPLPPLDWALKKGACLWWGVGSNLVLSPPVPKGDLSQIHPKNPAEVQALWAKYGEYAWSGAAAQGCYVFTHEPLRPLIGVPAAYIRSAKDTFVLDSGLEGWRSVVDLTGRVLYVAGGHISLMDEPLHYETATQAAFELVG